MKGHAVIALKPSRPLGQAGSILWTAVTSGYTVSSPAAFELLVLVCEESDRRAALVAERRALTESGPVASRLNRDITQCTALIANLLNKLDRFVTPHEQRRGPGRPSINLCWDGKHGLE
jgi:hypothetical protein